MTSKTDKIRAALEYLVDWQSKDGADVVVEVAQEALSELDGCVIVPVEPTAQMVTDAHRTFLNHDTAIMTDYWREDMAKKYRAMIAPYVNGEKK